MLAFWNGKEKSYGGASIMDTDRFEVERFKPDYMTWYDNWPNFHQRATGQYRLGTATSELIIINDASRDWHYHLRMKFVKLEDGQKLYTLIYAGKILPVTSYEGTQHATVLRQFGDLW